LDDAVLSGPHKSLCLYQNSFAQRYQLVPVEAVSQQNLKLKRKSARFCPSGSKQVFHCPCETIPSGSLSTRRPGCSGHRCRAMRTARRPGLGVDGMAPHRWRVRAPGLGRGRHGVSPGPSLRRAWVRVPQVAAAHARVCAHTVAGRGAAAGARRVGVARPHGRCGPHEPRGRWCRARCGAVLMCSLYSVQLARRSGWGSFSFGGY